ncbi:AraC family transcriptional regulator [Agaribacter flavus]|uniref:GyrI-like domain-containing protein n=1 Tax=Agaribacter flavus TaxID=1902781 RepID=A0ABV7FTX0_9ALTE
MPAYQTLYRDVLKYIEDNIDENLNVEALCKHFGLSKYHFHRQCSAYFGMPLISLVRLLRLKRAAFQLAYRTEEKIVNIAIMSAYDSHEAFTRTFRRYFNMSPSEFRQSPDWTAWQTKYSPVLKLRDKIVKDKHAFQVKVVDFAEVKLAVLPHLGSPKLLGKTIQSFIQWRKENNLPPSKSRTFNLVYDDPNTVAPEDYRFDICCSIKHDVPSNQHGVMNNTIPRGKCALIRHIGSDDSIGLPLTYLYYQWLTSSDYKLRDFPVFFERISFFPDVPENEMITDIYLPIEST